MNKWNARFLDMASLVATWSKDPGTRVGAVIVDLKNRVISLGFNGFPRGVIDDAAVLADRDEKLRRTIHAEENALLFARSSVDGCLLYVTHPPCGRCAAKIIQAGIIHVHSLHPSMGHRWEADIVSAQRMYAEAGVQFSIANGPV